MKGQLTCTIIEPKLSGEITRDMSHDEIKNTTEAMELYFSEDIPKLLPFEVALSAFVSPEIFETLEGGFVKNIDLEIKDYRK